MTNQEQYIEFGIGNENYAILISEIQEIIKYQEITEIPASRPYVRGIINLRGRIVPIISLRSLLSFDEEHITKSTRIVVVNHREESVGIIVDRVIKVAMFTDIQPPPDHLGVISGAYFVGIGISGTELVGILKLDQVLLHE